MRPPHPEELGPLVPQEITPLDDRLAQAHCLLIQMSYVLQRVLVGRGKWDKTSAAQDLAMMTELLKGRYPELFPPVPPIEGS